MASREQAERQLESLLMQGYRFMVIDDYYPCFTNVDAGMLELSSKGNFLLGAEATLVALSSVFGREPTESFHIKHVFGQNGSISIQDDTKLKELFKSYFVFVSSLKNL